MKPATPPSLFPALAGLLLLCALLLSAAPRALGQDPIPYEPAIEGAPSEELADILRESLDCFTLRDKPPTFRRLLASRARNDLETIETVLNSKGYFEAVTSIDINYDVSPVKLIFRVTPGPAFSYGTIRFELENGEEPVNSRPTLPCPEETGLASGKPYDARQVVDARSELLVRVIRQGYPFARSGTTDLVADHSTDRVDILLTVVPGPLARFGDIRLEGLETVEESYVRTRLTWKPGELYDPEKVRKTREKLIATGLFGGIDIKLDTGLDEQDRLPVTITLRERKHRTMSAGLFYETWEGFGVQGGWEHRNFLGRGERFQSSLRLSQRNQILEGNLREEEFLREDQSLLLSSRLAHEETQAYVSSGLTAAAGVERDLGRNATLGLGLGYTLSRLKDETDDTTEDWGLVSLPVSLTLDRRDDILNPTRGFRVSAEFAPYADTLGHNNSFIKVRASAAGYLPLWRPDRLVLAMRLAGGAISGAGRSDVPIDLRFFAGGGGSIRGYGYQMAGELDDDDTPLGGLSLLSGSLELRTMVTEDVGLVAFLDGGRAFADGVPNFSENPFWGAGLGLRYYTPIGPLRFDVALPLNAREADEDYQIYMSLGQAF